MWFSPSTYLHDYYSLRKPASYTTKKFTTMWIYTLIKMVRVLDLRFFYNPLSSDMYHCASFDFRIMYNLEINNLYSDFLIAMHNSPKNLMKLIATDTQTLLVFEATSLKWAAQLPFTPIIMKRANFMVNICEVLLQVLGRILGEFLGEFLGEVSTLRYLINEYTRLII